MTARRFHVRLKSLKTGHTRQTTETVTQADGQVLCDQLNAALMGRITYNLVPAGTAGEPLSSGSPASQVESVPSVANLHP